MNDARHLDIEMLAALVTGALTGEELRSAAAHLATGCRRCVSQHALFADVLALARADDSAEPPPHVLVRALRIMPHQAMSPAPLPLSRRVRALLLFDSRTALSPAGARGGETGTRQVLYGVDELQLEIGMQIRRPDTAGGAVEVIGQIFTKGDDSMRVAGLPVELTGPLDAATTTTSPLGLFRVTVAGAESLLVTDREWTIEIPLPLP